jgi:hypothetical protein
MWLFKENRKGVQWFNSVALGTQEAKIRRTAVRGQPGQKVHETPISVNGCLWWYEPVIPAGIE